MNDVQQCIVSSANCIRNELQKSSYQIPWPSETDDLDVQTFPEFPLLQEFLLRQINNESSPKSDRIKRLSLSFAQDLFFALHNGKKLTPKNMLLPLQIKLLTNNTELITTVSRLGHGVSYTKFSEITTEVACSIINKCFSGMVFLPEQCQKHQFTMIVEDNIDRNEQTLTDMLKYGFTLLLIRLHNSDNTMLKLSNFITVIFYDFPNGNMSFFLGSRELNFTSKQRKQFQLQQKSVISIKKLLLDFKALTLSCCCHGKNSKARGEHFTNFYGKLTGILFTYLCPAFLVNGLILFRFLQYMRSQGCCCDCVRKHEGSISQLDR